MKKYNFVLMALIMLAACSTTKHWTGTSTLEGTQGAFKELNGKQTFTIQIPDNDTYLKYHFTVTGGKLETIIQSPKEKILNQELSSMVTDSIHIVNQQGAEYKIYMRGKQASGAFDVYFTESNK